LVCVALALSGVVRQNEQDTQMLFSLEEEGGFSPSDLQGIPMGAITPLIPEIYVADVQLAAMGLMDAVRVDTAEANGQEVADSHHLTAEQAKASATLTQLSLEDDLANAQIALCRKSSEYLAQLINGTALEMVHYRTVLASLRKMGADSQESLRQQMSTAARSRENLETVRNLLAGTLEDEKKIRASGVHMSLFNELLDRMERKLITAIANTEDVAAEINAKVSSDNTTVQLYDPILECTSCTNTTHVDATRDEATTALSVAVAACDALVLANNAVIAKNHAMAELVKAELERQETAYQITHALTEAQSAKTDAIVSQLENIKQDVKSHAAGIVR